MHSFLIVSGNKDKIEQEVEKIKNALKATIHRHDATKIEDVRELSSITKLKFSSPTLFYLREIDKSTQEAANALLKSIEEPQENVYYALSAKSLYYVLPTISSRCQIIEIKGFNKKKSNYSKTVISGKFKDKVKLIENIKGKEEALEFIENTIYELHHLLKSKREVASVVKTIKHANLIRNNLYKNGNVSLQLSKFIIDS